MSELSAVKALSAAWDWTGTAKDQDFIEFQLDDFAVYCDTAKFSEEMRSLHHLDTKTGHGNFYFDGILSVKDTRVYVRRVPISAVPVQNYGALSVHSVKDHIWLRSTLNASRNIYYRLCQPAREYRRFFNPFMWVADLAKHFVDFLKVMGDSKRKVTILHFRSMFATWLRKTHKNAPDFLAWLALHPSEDYRTSIVANIAFLHKEAVGVLDPKDTYFHTIWAEIWEFQRYPDPPKDQLEAVPLSAETEKLRNGLIQERHLEFSAALHDSTKNMSIAAENRIKNIKPGDTISTHRDDEGSGTQWQREVSKGCSDVDRWFALVQKVHTKKDGRRLFDVIWYYRPIDTLCGLMKYPWNNELFLSNHCSCSERAKIDESEILGVHDVDFGGTSATNAELFCRQTYLHEERRWITLKEAHMLCKHAHSVGTKKHSLKYLSGDTLLIHLDLNSEIAEPCELVSSFREESRKVYRCRRLLRRRAILPATSIRPNELVYSEQLVEVKKTRILGRCHVRFFRAADHIPTPYDRDGVGNFFYITHREAFINGALRCVPLEKVPPSLKQGFDPDQEIPKLRGMDLFCGGGNFGRGLEDGGAIEMKWANDYDSRAIHTYMANVASPGAVHPFLGSIDNLQRLAIQGKFANNVPPIGDVDFISGGSPCPGFSRLTNDKTTITQRKNQSLVASFASIIDLYRPKYGLLENVPGIVHKKADRNDDVFSQLICALVGLGYQTQFFFLDASSCGSSQRRSRVFVMFAAPGLELPQKPTQTHSHPPKTSPMSIGWLPNGQHMATRGMPTATPFKYVTAEEVTADLPVIYDAKPDICISHPDHRMATGLTRMLRVRCSLVPTRPWGMNFAQAWYGEDKKKPGSGVITVADRGYFTKSDTAMDITSQPLQTRPSTNAFGRLHPHRLMETIVTRQNPGDAKNGRQLHWQEDRVLTVMEARRAQGIRDDEVLLGNPTVQYKIVGNSVAREVAVALGAVIREAWAATLKQIDDEDDRKVEAQGGMIKEEDGDIKLLPVEDNISDSDDMESLIDRFVMPTAINITAQRPPSLASSTTLTNNSASEESGDTITKRKRLVVQIPSSSSSSKRQRTTRRLSRRLSNTIIDTDESNDR
ncbi:DNA (cytosine-5)-methyltransferase 1A-like protein [Cladobotryum mycophilum]|uniref:DNA (cytosine-5-)-methyltransferase n=1 Tax=Cladobotryum mycophilum TaxID=491253 RepID=A0ABR0SUW0_9HYPO